MSKDMTVKLVLDTIKKAVRNEKVTAELQLHSDQGAQYVSHEYFTLTQSGAVHISTTVIFKNCFHIKASLIFSKYII